MVNELLSTFRYKIQIDIMQQAYINIKAKNIHLMDNFNRIKRKIWHYLTRTGNKHDDQIWKKLEKIMICNVFTGWEVIFKRMLYNGSN